MQIENKEELALWEEMVNKLFNGDVPLQKVWSDKNEIIQVLDGIGTDKAANHTFLPDGGGHDLSGCIDSLEEGCIELDLRSPRILKPKRLIFEWFENVSYEWAYFILEADELELSGVYPEVKGQKEQLLELQKEPNDLVKYIEYTEDDDVWKNNVRCVIRYKSGRFIIFPKFSKYNLVFNQYDGKHNELLPEEFKFVISKVAKK